MRTQAAPSSALKPALLAAVITAYRHVDAAERDLEEAREAVLLAHRWAALAPPVRAAALQAHGSLGGWEAARKENPELVAAQEADWAAQAADQEACVA